MNDETIHKPIVRSKDEMAKIAAGRVEFDTATDALREQGCHPSVYERGIMFRFHVNRFGNFWHDAKTPLEALRGAVKAWEDAGRPEEG
jgi:hypothetical protein